MGFKIRDLLKAVKIGTSVGSVVAPGGVGKILDAVNKSIDDKDDPNNEAALKTLAEVNERQTGEINELTSAVLALHERLKKLEGK